MAIVTGDRYIELLESFIDRHAEELLVGSLVLKLNPVGLLYLQSRLASLEELEELRVNAPVDYLRAYVSDLGDYRKLEKLRRFLLLLESLQVVSLTKGVRDPTPVSLLSFGRLRVLEIRGCDLSTSAARGLADLRPHLETLICVNSANALEHIFGERVADAHAAQGSLPWASLTNVCCSSNGLLLMDEALQILPAIRRLDLSRNALTKVANLEHCPALQSLDLSFNHISAVDSLGNGVTGLTTLILRGNALLTTRGLEGLKHLEKLDLGHNMLSSLLEVARLHDLPSLHHLWLEGNPVAELPKYRLHVLCFFSEPYKIVLDGRTAGSFEKLALQGFLRLHSRETLILEWTPFSTKSVGSSHQDEASDGSQRPSDQNRIEEVHPSIVLPSLQMRREEQSLAPDSFNSDYITPTWSQNGTEVSDTNFLAVEDQALELDGAWKDEFQGVDKSTERDVSFSPPPSSSSSSTAEWSDSETGVSNTCSPEIGSNSRIGQLMADFKSRFSSLQEETPVLAKEGSTSFGGVHDEAFFRMHEEDNNGIGSMSSTNFRSGFYSDGNVPAVGPLSLGEVKRWNMRDKWSEGKTIYDKLASFDEGGPLLDGYRDDAMATAGGGRGSNPRRPFRYSKLGGERLGDGEDDVSEGSGQVVRMPDRWAAKPWKETNRMERSGGLEASSAKLSKGKGKGHREKASEDELETCFRRTVGDQKTDEHSVGYVPCGCVRVWKEEKEESPTILLFSSDSKVYILREEMSQSTLTHRQDLVLRVIASHKLTDVKRLVVGLGLQILRVHAGAASEYVIVTRSVHITSELVQRLAGGISALHVDSWGTEQLQCMERLLFDGQKTNVRLYSMLHYRSDIDTGERWVPVTLIMTSRFLVLCSEALHLFAPWSGSRGSEEEGKKGGQEDRDYFIPQAQRAIRELQKIVPSRRDRCQVSLVFVGPGVPLTAVTMGVRGNGTGRGEDDPGVNMRASVSVWEIRFPQPTALQQALPLLRAALLEAKESHGDS